jgi:hypothetical protein
VVFFVCGQGPGSVVAEMKCRESFESRSQVVLSSPSPLLMIWLIASKNE